MQAGFVFALEGDARAVHLGEAVGVIDVAAEGLLDAAAGLFGVRFGADKGLAQGEVLARVNALLFEEAGEVEGVAGQDMDRGRAEVLHEHQLPLGGAGAGGNDQAAHLLRAVVHHQPAGEQAVAHHVLKDILLGDAGHDERAGNEFGGVINVFAREEDGLGLAGRAAGGVQAHRFVAINGQHAVGIDGPQVGAGGKRQPAHVGQRLDLLGAYAQLREPLLVKRHALRHALDGVLQAFELQLFECWAG